MQKIIKAVIFDLDGVIIDSNPEIEKFWHSWAARTEKSLTRNDITNFIHGRKGVETLEVLFNDIPDETREAIIKDAIVFDSQMNPEPVGGIYNFIQSLLILDIPVGLVTSSHKERALLMLQKQKLDTCFEAFVTAEDVIRGKPDPQPYLAIAEKLNLQPEHCLVFEDAISGVQSAKAAGMEVVGINIEDSAEALLANGASSVVANFESMQIQERKLVINNITYTL